MTDFLTRLGALTLGGTAAILLLGGLFWLTCTRYAACWRCWCWLLICLRMALPFSLVQPIPTRSMPVQISLPTDRVVYQTGQLPPTAPDPGGPPIPASAEAENHTAPSIQARFVLTRSGLVFLLWLAGAAVVLIGQLRRYGTFLRYLRRWTEPVTKEAILQQFQRTGAQMGLQRLPRLLICPGLSAPMLAGLLCPYLLLPWEELDPAQLHSILLHELTHYRRRDIFFKALVLWVCVLHWFNPAVWWMARLVEQELELACDDAVLVYLPAGDRVVYAETILKASGQ
ncbi:MAG: M56 family metallopeptidase [Oscillospiraceae bacterium]|nr:M56 family metallopeptidase [Oscillospiraceae bacterium]